MPFTLAHPAAVIPLRNALGRHSVLSAMIIGSMSPDLHHFLPVDLGRSETHSIAGTVLFCLPVGMLLYLVFHLLIKQPLLALMPERVAARVNADAPLAPPSAVLLSLLFGAMTHFVWDTFTHADALGVALFPFLDLYLFTVKGYPVFVYKLVQHGSAVIGLLLMAWWSVRWLREKSAAEPHRSSVHPARTMLTTKQRIAIVCSIVLIAGFAGLVSAAATVEPPFDIYALRSFLREAVVTTISAIGAAGLVYSLTWHILHARRN